MPGLYFLDTSELLPRLLRRAPGHAWVEQICALASQNTIIMAEVTEAEIAAARTAATRRAISDISPVLAI